MSNFFTKKELLRLGCTDDEIKLVMQYQKKLPILTKSNDEYIDCKYLYTELCVSKDYTSWIKQMFESMDVDKSEYILTYTYVGERKNIKKSIYEIKVSLAKEIAMVAGVKGGRTSKELKKNSKIVRKYFILMERLVKANQDWWTSRNVERTNYKPLCESLSNSIHRQCGRCGDKYDFAREANILNIISTGSNAQEIRNYLNIQSNELTRDSLEKDYNEKLSFLQDQDILLLGMDMPIVDRVKFLINLFDIKYPTASPLLSYLSREDLISARNRLLNTLENK